MTMRVFARSAAAVLGALAVILGAVPSVGAAPTGATTASPEAVSPTLLPMAAGQAATHARTVSDVPSDVTPHIHNGTVSSIAKVGSTVVVAGNFSEISQTANSSTMARTGIFAFDADTGQISTTFNPTVANGQVMSVIPGPVPGTVYVGGSFSGINGGNRRVVLLDVSTGQLVPSFQAPSINSAVRDLALVGDRLIVGGQFHTVGGQPHGGLVSLDASTGQRQDFLTVQLTENHNYEGQPGASRAPVGARAIAVDPAGTTLAVVGNFRKADGLDRRQMVLVDLSGATAVVRPDWRTRRYEPACAWRAFDTYMRDISVSPDGKYFVVATTGAANPGTLCDTVARWDLDAVGDSVQPVWSDESGGDTILSVAASGHVVYAGGHQRWHNNSGGRDFAAAGAVPRAGLVGFHPDWGLPVSWNPGRNPRGVGAEALLVTESGLYVGSDTVWIGDRDYRRSRLAYFPLAGGQELPAGDNGSLPSSVYVASPAAEPPAGDVLFRVNAGGPELQANDGGPSWVADSGVTSPWRNSGSNVAVSAAVPAVDSTVPASAPPALFDTERWDPETAPEMSWAIPVPSGQQISVRLYLASRCTCTQGVGMREFSVQLDGAIVLDGYDIVADVGHDVGTMKEFTITSDGEVNIDFRHVTENPLINAIEIVEHVEDDAPSGPTPLARVWYDGGTVTEDREAAPHGGIDWASVRGATVIDGVLYYISGSNVLKRTFDGSTYGPEEVVDPYNDPNWADVFTSSGGHYYRGVVPSFYGQLSTIRGLAFEDGRIYYTRVGQNQVFHRKFVPGPAPSGDVMSQAVGTVPGFSQPSLGDIFIDTAGGYLYFSNTATGDLSRIGWEAGTVSGLPEVVSGPSIDGMSWRGTAIFPANGPGPRDNEAPTASFTADCTDLACSFDGSASADPDGVIVSYTWDFGDSATGEGVQVEHTYGHPGEYTITLTVTDDVGVSTSTSRTVVVAENVAPVAVVSGSCVLLECSFSGAGSSDSDGDVVGYSWDFGDGSPVVEGAEVSHEYGAAGAYEVTLTVVDDSGATAVATMTVEVATTPGPAAPELVGFSARQVHGSSSSLALPDEVDAGDSLVLFVTSSNPDPVSQPTGVGPWEVLEEIVNGQMTVRVYAREADGSEGGGTVSFSWGGTRKTDLTALVYRGADLSGLQLASAVGTGTTSHPSPTVEVPAGSHRALTYWADRGSNTLTWTAPEGVEVVSTQVGTGGGRVSSLVADAQVPGAGAYGGLVATTSATANRTAYLTLILTTGA